MSKVLSFDFIFEFRQKHTIFPFMQLEVESFIFFSYVEMSQSSTSNKEPGYNLKRKVSEDCRLSAFSTDENIESELDKFNEIFVCEIFTVSLT